MEKLSISLWVLIVLFCYTSVCFGCTEEERNGLLKFEPFVGYSNKTSDCCGWERVKCDNATRRIVSLDLNSIFEYYDQYEEFVLDASLFLPFPQLQYLDLSWNWELVLQNHQDLGRLNKLEVLNLGYNYFNDIRIFKSLSKLESLTVLELHNNLFNASLPDIGPDVCKLKNLRELYLGWNKLSGTIPSCFNNLTSLKALDLSHNYLIGKLHPYVLFTSLEYLSLNGNLQFNASPMFSSLASRECQFRYLDLSDCNINISTTVLLKFLHSGTKLLVLDISNNKLHGEFPNLIFEKNFNLRYLGFGNNSLTGRIHLPIGHSVDLEWFDVSYNHIHGELQPNLGYVLPKLLLLNIANNSLGGEIPTSIHTMKDLKSLDLSGNNLSGKLPERLVLSCKRLELIYLSNNRIEGRIPDNIFNLTELVFLDLGNNQFSGHIPGDNFRSFKLRTFNVNQNRISGKTPSWLGNLTKDLYYIDLSENQLSGPMPSSLITQSSLKYLYLQHNKFTGPLPNALPFNYSSLLVLDVSDNNLSGRIPNWFGFLLHLYILSVKGNHFSGPIPHELCSLQNIGIMDISHNILSGSIPFCFTNITFGRNASDHNQHYGFIVDIDVVRDLTDRPMQFFDDSLFTKTYEFKDVQFVTKSRTNSYKGANIGFMSGMDLSCNNLEGDIPLNIGDLTELRAMNLSHNRFIGVIPSSLSKMKQIESLDLSHNKLSGEIPSNVTHLTFLVAFNVAYNNLSGRLPEMSAQFNTFSETSYEGNPFLCGPPLLKQCGGINPDLANTMDTLSGGDYKFGINRTSFLASFAATYATYLLAFVIVLCINPHWRGRWFYFIDVCISFVFPFWSEAIQRVRI